MMEIKWNTESIVVWMLVLGYVIEVAQCQERDCTDMGNPAFELNICDLQTPCIASDVTPNPGKCSMYMMCSSGRWQQRSCPPPMQFSNETFQCCLDLDPGECQPECPPTIPSTDGPSMLCDSTPTECEDGDRAPDKNNCDKYFECIFEIWELRQCSVGTAFDPVTLECIEDIELANCAYRCLTTAAPTTEPPTRELQTTFMTKIVSDTDGPATYEGYTVTDVTGVIVTTLESGPDQTTTHDDPDTTTVPTTRSKITLTRTSTTTTTRPPTTVPTTTGGSNTHTDNANSTIIIGSVCGAVGAVVLVVMAILAQNGVIRCDRRSKAPAPPPGGVMAPGYFPSSRSSTSLHSTNNVHQYNPEYRRHSVFADKDAQLFAFTHVDSVISERSGEHLITEESLRSHNMRTPGSQRSEELSTSGKKNGRNSKLHNKIQQMKRDPFADALSNSMGLHDVISVKSEASSEDMEINEPTQEEGPNLPVPGVIDV